MDIPNLKESPKPEDGAKRSLKVFDTPMTLEQLQAELCFMAHAIKENEGVINRLLNRVSSLEHAGRNNRPFNI
jgi:hypothetical protein